MYRNVDDILATKWAHIDPPQIPHKQEPHALVHLLCWP